MKVVHLTASTIADTTGGLEYHIAYLTEGLRKRGHQIEVLKTHAGATDGPSSMDVYHPAPTSGFDLARLGYHISSCADILKTFVFRLCRNWSAMKMIKRIDACRPDVIHQHCYISNILMTWLLAKRYPVVFTNHTGAYLYLDRWAVTRGLQRRVMKAFSAVIAPSRELLPETKNSHYVPNGVDTGVFYPLPSEQRNRVRARLGFAEDTMVFVCPRRWAPTKGIIYLAKAITRLSAATRKKCAFVFAGNVTAGYEGYQHSVRRRLQTVTDGDVRIIGNLSHAKLAELLNAADVCVIPSLLEATSLACLEAMACGTPVLATDTGGLSELIENGKNGWLVPSENSVVLAKAIETIVHTTSQARASIRDTALMLVRQTYTWERIAAQTDKIYHAAIERWTLQGRPAAESQSPAAVPSSIREPNTTLISPCRN